MCGRYVLKREDLEKMLEHVGVRVPQAFQSRYNIAPTFVVPVVRTTKSGEPEATALRWSLIPSWTKPDAPVKPLVNVRAETLLSRFGRALQTRRCILPASGFYEWEAAGGRKQPWYFSMRSGQPFGLGGIWDLWRGSDGTELETCAVITTTPNRVLQPVHERMPVMLTPDQCRKWLGTAETGPLEQMMTSAPDDAIVALRVGPAVSSVRNDGPECIAAAIDEPGGEPQLSLGF